MQCSICSREKDQLIEGPYGVQMCQTCFDACCDKSPVDEDVTTVDAGQNQDLKCEMRIGIMGNNDLYVNTVGSNVDLITLEGLLAYARRWLDLVWEKNESKQEIGE
jgi:hypothetical protein